MISVKWSWETITINTELLCSVNLQQQYLARLDRARYSRVDN